MGVEYYSELLESQYAGLKWIIISDVAAGAGTAAERILAAGAEAVLVIAGTRGTGPQPHPDIEVCITGATGTTLMGGIRAFARTVTDPSPAVCGAIEAFDPTGRAHVLSSYLIPAQEVCGRPVYGGARPEWKVLEDKLLIEEVWQRAGIERAKALIVESGDADAIDEAIRQVASADGAVLAADNTEGWHGGGEYTRYVAPGADRNQTFAFFSRHAQQVRVMPFLRGVPCSIHGLVGRESVLAFRPVEMLVYRRPGSDEFVYTGMATPWDPPIEGRELMREAIRAVGSVIRDDYGYRGAFGIDGVCTADGFLPTELNPRLTGGLGMQAQSAGGYPIGDINRAVIAGAPVDLRLGALEKEIVAGADATRGGRWSRPITHLSAAETTEQPLGYDGHAWAPSESLTTATMSLGPSPQGALVAFKLGESHGLRVGDSIAEVAASSFAVSDQLWDTRVGRLIAGNASYV